MIGAVLAAACLIAFGGLKRELSVPDQDEVPAEQASAPR